LDAYVYDKKLINRVKKFPYDLPFNHNTFVTDDDDRRTDRETTHRAIDVRVKNRSVFSKSVAE